MQQPLVLLWIIIVTQSLPAELQKCKRPVDPANGNVLSRKRNEKLFNVGEKIWFKCDNGFDLVGNKDLVCQRDGSWKPQPFPRCVRRIQKCKRPVDPANGNVLSRKRNEKLFNVGEKIWFKCDNGFDLVGNKDLVCQRDGSWKPQPFPKCVRRTRPTQITVVACERDFSKHLRCPRGSKIQITRGFYGRDDRHTCPSKAIYSVNCLAKNSLNKLKELCDNQNTCQLQPSNTVFGDPCHGTFKYIEVTYICTTNRPVTPPQNTVVACERDFSKHLRCPGDTNIQIVKGFYGRDDRHTCPSKAIHTVKCLAKNSLNKLKELCNNQNTCRLQPSNKVFGDPCHGTFKYIEVTFFCALNTPAAPTQFSVIACERDFSKFLRCPRNTKIQIVKGFYGRDDRHTCPSRAIHTDKCFAKNSLNTLKKLCDNQNTCRLQPSNKVFGDPCHGTFKYIEVIYFCRKH